MVYFEIAHFENVLHSEDTLKNSPTSVEEKTEHCRSYNVDDMRTHMNGQAQQRKHCNVDGPLT